MRILLLTVTAGYSHHATAKALADLFAQKAQKQKLWISMSISVR